MVNKELFYSTKKNIVMTKQYHLARANVCRTVMKLYFQRKSKNMIDYNILRFDKTNQGLIYLNILVLNVFDDYTKKYT